MSLILDALRKADAERERGSVPGLRSQPVVPPSDAAVATKATARLGWPSVAIGVGVGLALAAAWLFIGRTPDERSVATRAAPASPTLQTPAPVPGVAVAPPPAAAPPSTPASARPVDATPSAPAATPLPIAEPAPWTRPGERAADPAAIGVPPPRASSGATGSLPVYPHELLPSQVRAALPPLSISGSIYSSDPRGRSLIVNGRLMREGSAVTPELTLEEIRLKSAIFAFRAYRFEVPF